jgi:hypothetical protein
MITFLNLGKYGRLGNQLFQYAALKAAALRNNYECKLPNFEQYEWHGQNCLLNNFNIKYDVLHKEEEKFLKHNFEEYSSYAGVYTPILENIPNYSNINGFFQNTKYFFDFKEQIVDEICLKEHILKKQNEYIYSLKKNNTHLVSLHIRTGDMIDGTNPIYHKFYGSSPFDTSATFGNYISKCLDMYNSEKNVKFIVFVGGSRSGNDVDDILWAKKYFVDSKFIVSESNDPIIDFARISLCDDNIISFSSTFSWWAAFTNKNKNKKVLCPKDFHFDNIERQNFYPNDWIIIN